MKELLNLEIELKEQYLIKILMFKIQRLFRIIIGRLILTIHSKLLNKEDLQVIDQIN